jgi:hypothetical protein
MTHSARPTRVDGKTQPRAVRPLRNLLAVEVRLARSGGPLTDTRDFNGVAKRNAEFVRAARSLSAAQLTVCTHPNVLLA